MNVRITCDHCSGELELPHVPAGQEIRCPQCGELLISTIAPAAPAAPKSAPLSPLPKPAPRRREAPAPWSPPDDDLDDVVPWYIWLLALSPAAMLAIVALEPIAFVIAGVLVALALVIASRASWSKVSRVMGIVCLTLAGLGSSVAANLYGQGSFANFKFATLLAGLTGPSLELDHVPWSEIVSEEDNFAIDFPGPATRLEIHSEQEITAFEAKYPRQNLAFAVYTFKFAMQKFDESSENAYLQKVAADIAPWLAAPGDSDPQAPPRRFFFHEHPGYDLQFTVPDFNARSAPKKQIIVSRAYLVRDRGYIVSVAAPPERKPSSKKEVVKREEMPAAIKLIADKFFASFRLLQPVAPLNTIRREPESDGKRLKRLPAEAAKPLASFRGHFKPPVSVLAFSVDGKSLYSGSGLEHLLKWDLATGYGRPIADVELTDEFALHPSGAFLVVQTNRATGGRPKERLRPVPLKVKEPPLQPMFADRIVFPPGDSLALAAIDDRVSLYDVRKGEMWRSSPSTFWSWLEEPETIWSMALTTDGRLLATVNYEDATIALRDVEQSAEELATWDAHDAKRRPPAFRQNATVQQLAFSPDKRLLASAGLDSLAKVWDIADARNPKLLATLPHDFPAATVEYSGDGKLLATGDVGGVVRIWDTSSNKLVHEFRATAGYQDVQRMRFSPDNELLAVAVEMGTSRAGVNLFELKSLPRSTIAPPPPPAVEPYTNEEPPLFNDGAPKKK